MISIIKMEKGGLPTQIQIGQLQRPLAATEIFSISWNIVKNLNT